MAESIIRFLNEYLRINAIRRMLSMVEIRRTEVGGLVLFAVLFAVFEGVGLSLLLPILQFAEDGTTAISEGASGIWGVFARVLSVLGLPETLPVLLVMAFVPIMLRQLVFYFNAWYSAAVSGRIGVRMRIRTLDAILDADPEFFSRRYVGRLVDIVIGQSGSAGAAILAVVRQLSIVLLMLLYMSILLMISVPLTAITGLSALLVSAVVRSNFAKIRDYGVKAARVNQELMGKIVERFGLIRLIKLRDQKDTEAERIEQYSDAMREIGIRQARLGANVEVASDPLLMLSVFVTLYVGITFLNMTLAQLGLLLFLLNRLNAKVKEFNAGQQVISANMAGLLLVQEATADARASNRIVDGPLEFEGLKREIELKHVSFSYPTIPAADGFPSSPGKDVLSDVSILIPAGSFTALVGRSGAGKSTLVELIPRMHEVTGGAITFDGVDIRQFRVGSLRKGIGYLTQNPMLFNATVRENLLYGLDVEPTEAEIRSAIERAYASFVLGLPAGLDTRLGDAGVRFSGGERQRLGLARVLLENTSIIVLDEPTSSLDSESEAYIQKALHDLHGEKTIIVIAHRLATVIQADQLLVVEDGGIVQRGTHAELVEHEGPYRRLFESQLIT